MLLPSPFAFSFPNYSRLPPRRPFPSYPLSESTSTFCFSPSILSSAPSTRCFVSIPPSAPLHCNFQPFLSLLPPFFSPHTAYLLFVFFQGTQMLLLHSNISSTLLTLFSKLLFYYFTSPFFFATLF